MKLQTLRPRVAALDSRAVKPPPKAALPFYQTPEYLIWREQVIHRAGGRCEAIEAGFRCTRAAPRHRMFADHRIEIRDGGAALDVSNGQCLCGSHHTAKTAQARADRR